MIRALAGLVLAVLVWTAAAAQETPIALDPEWIELAERAETVLEAGRAAPEALAVLRSELVDWRGRFDAATGANATRIETLRAQIAALGEPPAEGETEAPEIADQRADLEGRLDTLLAPVREAQAAFSRADGLVRETDTLIDAGRTEELLAQVSPPINPARWPPAIAALGAAIRSVGDELAAPFVTPTERAVWMGRGVQLGILVFIAVMLLWRSRVWLGRLRDRIARHEATSPGARLGLIAISLARTVLPVIGLVVVTRILVLLGVAGPGAATFSFLLPVVGLVIFGSHWLGLQAFPPRETSPTLLPIPVARRREGRLHVLVLGILFALSVSVESSLSLTDHLGVLHFALLVVAGLTLLRLGQLLLSELRVLRSDTESEEGFWARPLSILARGLLVVAIVAPIAAGLGFVELGIALLWSTVLSLALLTVLGTAQRAIFDIYAAIRRRPDAGEEALLPTLVGFALAVAALPILALIWGVRFSTLTEWWQTFLRGFSLGDTQISPANFLTFALVFTIGYLVTRAVKAVLGRSVLPKTRLDTGGTNAILSGTGYVGITLAALLAITAAGINLGGLAIVAGALSVGVGFGLQTIVQNFVSGIILLIERPIKLGDWIDVNGTHGFVRQISVRSTRIETFDRQDVIIPNADLISGVVTNYTLGNSSGRLIVPVGVAYGTDTRKIEAILREIAEAHPMVVLNPPPLISFEGFGADSLDFQMRVVLRDILWIVVTRTELNHQIAERFAAEGIEIPFAQRDVWLRNPEALRAPRPETP
ncbi:DUF3772 domain-containing protein [Jannaschia sp. KMU-145]|uniref:DUF3772 domain-containing protein n=1 Tax=Jannaschia halovivens TaxID=3388667 RepID=UPI00396B384A